MKRWAVVVLLSISLCAVAQDKPKTEPTAAELQVQIAQQRVEIAQMRLQIAQLQISLNQAQGALQADTQASTVNLVRAVDQAQADLANAQHAAQPPK